jgi:hypothetical protein
VHLPGGHIPHPPPAGVNNIGPNATRLMDGRQKADLEKLRMMNEVLGQFAARRATLEVEIKRLRARLRLLGCAMGRAEKAGAEKCGFDVRIVMNDEEWTEWLEGEGKWALEEQVEGEEQRGEDAYGSAEGVFCVGKKRCERHNGGVLAFFGGVVLTTSSSGGKTSSLLTFRGNVPPRWVFTSQSLAYH